MGMAAAVNPPQFHVLAVDDSLIDRKLVERLFITSSCQVTTVDSGIKALEFLGLAENDQKSPNQASVLSDHNQEVDVNLIITDYCMPGMTGYDLLKRIKESAALRNIPVVIMSSENVPSRISRCLEEGAEEFFLKPVRLSDVDKLKPHMMKARCQKHHKPEEIDDKTLSENQAESESSVECVTTKDVQSLLMTQLPLLQEICPLEHPQSETEHHQPQTDTNNNNNNNNANNNNNNNNNSINSNKRKVLEEPGRPRTRTNCPVATERPMGEWEEHVAFNHTVTGPVLANTLLG
ncbi:unnamed protein product [Cuscuta epithymum]|uniref:Response regulatory domain-containing protein n=1 Tax=Cuscuta epithymum TaxID=186058 RepID=A0AAV0FHP4_9ASTE|nr:unnamed protein product [Cuscuta epithymum]